MCNPRRAPRPQCICMSSWTNLVLLDITAAAPPGFRYTLGVDATAIRGHGDTLFPGLGRASPEFGGSGGTAEPLTFEVPGPGLEDGVPPLLLATKPKHRDPAKDVSEPISLLFSEDVSVGEGVGAVVLTPDNGPAVSFDMNSSEVRIDGPEVTLLACCDKHIPTGHVTLTMAPAALYDIAGATVLRGPLGMIRGIAAEELVFDAFAPAPPPPMPDQTPRRRRSRPQTGQQSSLQKMSEGESFTSVCVMGPTFALGELARELRFRTMPNWVGHSLFRLELSDPYDPKVVYDSHEMLLHVVNTNDAPKVHAAQPTFSVQVGKTVRLSNVTLDDPDGVDSMKWMTLFVTASSGMFWLDDTFVAQPTDVLKPIIGSISGATEFRIQGSLAALQDFVRALRYGWVASVKPTLNLYPLSSPVDEVFVAFVLSDGVGPTAGAISQYQIAGVIINPATGFPVEDAAVAVTGPNSYYRYVFTNSRGTWSVVVEGGWYQLKAYKHNYETASRDLYVSGNVRVGEGADMFLSPKAVAVIYRIELEWFVPAGHTVDLDAHMYDNWGCHLYFARKQCYHPTGHGSTSTLQRDDQKGPMYREVVEMLAWPCSAELAEAGDYKEIQSCLVHYWVQVFSRHNFGDVVGNVSLYREEQHVMTFNLPGVTGGQAYWIGFTLDLSSHDVESSYDIAGGPEVIEDLFGVPELFPDRTVRRLKADEGAGGDAWLVRMSGNGLQAQSGWRLC